MEFDLAIEIKDGKTVVSAKAYDDDLLPYSLKVKDGIYTPFLCQNPAKTLVAEKI